MKKSYSILKIAVMCLTAISFTACGGDDDNGGNVDYNGGNGNSGGGSSTNTIILIRSNGEKYVSIAQFPISQNGDKNGYLTPSGEIWCMLRRETVVNPTYLHITLLKGEKEISDFPQGYDLGKINVTFGQVSYTYQSGSVIVKSNSGNTFMLEFNDYVAVNSRYSSNVTINGTLLVEKEVFL